jgi:hypothetical protein
MLVESVDRANATTEEEARDADEPDDRESLRLLERVAAR